MLVHNDRPIMGLGGAMVPLNFWKNIILIYKFTQNFRTWPLIFILGPPPTKVLQMKTKKKKLFDSSFCLVVPRIPR